MSHNVKIAVSKIRIRPKSKMYWWFPYISSISGTKLLKQFKKVQEASTIFPSLDYSEIESKILAELGNRIGEPNA